MKNQEKKLRGKTTNFFGQNCQKIENKKNVEKSRKITTKKMSKTREK